MTSFIMSIFGTEAIIKNLLQAINCMYIEFINTTDPITEIVPDKDEGIDYYNNLANSTNHDFLRVPITLKGLEKSDSNLITYDTINAAAIASGTGYFGKPFGQSNNSKIVGTALVIADWNEQDIGKDVVVMRKYFSPEDIITVNSTINMLISMKVTLT